MQWIKRVLFLYLSIIATMVIASVIALVSAPSIDRRPDTYYRAYWNIPETFDPTKCYESRGGEFIDMCLEGLYEYDGFKNPTKIVPALAKTMPVISEGRLTYTIRIRPNVRYPDVEPWKGRPRYVRAEDFVFALKRMADYHTASRHFDHYMRGRIVGVDDFFEYSKTVEGPEVDYDRPIEGIRALDDLTLQIKMNRPFPQFIYKLMMSAGSPMPREWYMYVTDNNTKPDELQWRILGTGPYQLADYKRERYCFFEANPMYRGRPDVDGNPNGLGGPNPSLRPESVMPHEVKRVEYYFNREQLPRWFKFTLGYYDRSRVPRDAYGSAIGINGSVSDELRERGVIQSLNPQPTTRYIGFAMDIPWIRENRDLRRAMSLAINRERYVSVFANGDGQPSNGLIPHAMNGYRSDHASPWEQHDPAEAMKLIESAKRFHRENFGGELPTITFTMGNTSALARQSSEDFRLAWQKIGLDVRTEHVEWGRFLENLRKRQYQCWWLGWVADYPDEETFLSLFYSPNRSPGPNGTSYSNSEYDALYQEAVTMQPGPKRRSLYDRMIAIIERDVPVSSVYYDVVRDLGYDWQGRLDESGNYIPEVQGHVWLKAKPAYYRLDAALRKARLDHGLTGPFDQLIREGRYKVHLPPPSENSP